jgi:3-isopropylmalate dehydrogenase
MNADIVVLGGDGIGPEVTLAGVRALQTTAEKFGHRFSYAEHLIGGAALDTCGSPFPEATLKACQSSNAVLLGAVGGPKWDDPLAKLRPEQGLLSLRKELGLFANLRPVKPHPALIDASPLKPERVRNVDVVVVRELTGGLYFGKPRGREQAGKHVRVVDTLEYHDFEITRVLELAFQLAAQRRRKVTSVDKANVLESSRLWRQIATGIGKQHPEVELEHMLVDTASMRLITSASGFDVLVTENMFGDILTDEASVLAGSMGMLPSASLGSKGPGVYEPIHGSAPDIAGKGVANPIGTILSVAMLLRHSLRLEEEAQCIEDAVDVTIQKGCRTVDIGGKVGTKEMTEMIVQAMKSWKNDN